VNGEQDSLPIQARVEISYQNTEEFLQIRS
jgi:hypothetical protein